MMPYGQLELDGFPYPYRLPRHIAPGLCSIALCGALVGPDNGGACGWDYCSLPVIPEPVDEWCEACWTILHEDCPVEPSL